jgi:PUA-domain protein
MSETKRRYFVREKEVAKLFDDFSKKLNIDLRQLFGAKSKVEVSETKNATIFLVNQRPLLAIWKKNLLPTLLFKEALSLLPKIVVNMGAVPYVCNGADIMAPGVVRIDKDFRKNDYVVITDERFDKPLVVAIAYTDSETARNLEHGKIAKNMHCIGDELWGKQLKK